MITRIKNGNVLVDGVFQKVDLFLDGKTIASIGTQMSFDQEVDAEGNYVTAGFIDLHCHGGGGADFSDGDVEGVLRAAKVHLQHGTTTLFPTALSADFDALEKAVCSIWRDLIFLLRRQVHKMEKCLESLWQRNIRRSLQSTKLPAGIMPRN